MGDFETYGTVSSGETVGRVSSGETAGFVSSGETVGAVSDGITFGTVPRPYAATGFYICEFSFSNIGRNAIRISYTTTESAECVIYTSDTPADGPWTPHAFAGLHGTAHDHLITGLTTGATYGMYITATNAGSQIVNYPPQGPNEWIEFTTGTIDDPEGTYEEEFQT